MKTSLLDQVISAHETGEPLMREQLRAIITRLQPKTSSKKLNGFKWVALAVCKKEIRQYLNYVYVEDGVAIATDCHRIHATPTILEDGYYCPKSGMKVDDQGKFPPWKRVIPSNTTLEDIEFIEIPALKKDSMHPINTNLGVMFCEKYVKDAQRNASPVISHEMSVSRHTLLTNYENGSLSIVMCMKP
jgi:hypothetical protein